MNKSLCSYRHLSNALYVRECLINTGVQAIIDSRKYKGTEVYILKVPEEQLKNSQAIVEKLQIDEKPVNISSKGYLKGMQNWMTNMYNPGHFTGLNAPHFLKDPSNRRIFGINYVFAGIIGLVLIFKNGINLKSAELFFLIPIYLFVGYWFIKRKE